jgi:hypothetical protein
MDDNLENCDDTEKRMIFHPVGGVDERISDDDFASKVKTDGLANSQ